MFLTASISVLVIVNLTCALLALGLGFAAGAWFIGGTKSDVSPKQSEGTQVSKEVVQATERALMASSRLKDLASGIACDVGTHAAVVGELNDAIHNASDKGSESVDAAVLAAMGKMIEANTHLQDRLAVAEKQIEAQAAEIQSQETEARTDSLTGLANRRAFDDELNRRVAEWQRKRSPVTLAILDIDFFKKFNDTHGHQAGDEVLRHVGKKLTEATRDMDVPCRYGGEEFSVIMPATSANHGKVVAERIRTAIEKTSINFEGKVLKVTASVGLAEIGDSEDAKLLLKRADDALYKSKEMGRNCGHLHVGDRIVPITPGMDDPKSTLASTPASAPVPDSPKTKTTPPPPAKKSLEEIPDQLVFSEELRRRVAESHRFSVPLSVMQVQICDYPRIREQFGHHVAHLTLEAVAQFINGTLREMDLLARGNDGRFAVMLPGSSQTEAEQIGMKVSTALAECVIPVGDTQLKLTVNCGIAEAKREDTAETLMRRAHNNMQNAVQKTTQATPAELALHSAGA